MPIPPAQPESVRGPYCIFTADGRRARDTGTASPGHTTLCL
ncbi:MAG: hypothetical protein R3E97_00720 [Candidatus Eisenbacteria bacterium]